MVRDKYFNAGVFGYSFARLRFGYSAIHRNNQIIGDFAEFFQNGIDVHTVALLPGRNQNVRINAVVVQK